MAYYYFMIHKFYNVYPLFTFYLEHSEAETKWMTFLKPIFMNGNVTIAIQISLKIVPRGPINNTQALVQVLAWCRTGNMPLPGPMLTQFTDTYMRH